MSRSRARWCHGNSYRPATRQTSAVQTTPEHGKLRKCVLFYKMKMYVLTFKVLINYWYLRKYQYFLKKITHWPSGVYSKYLKLVIHHYYSRMVIIRKLLCLMSKGKLHNFPQNGNKLNTESLYNYNHTFRLKPQRTESRDADRYLHTHVHNSVSHSSQKVAAAQMSTGGWWMNTIWSVYIYYIHTPDRTLFGWTKEWSPDTWHDMNEPWKHSAK